MKVPLLLAFGLCLSLTMPSMAQGPGGQQQQHQQQNKKKSQQKRQDRTHQRTPQQSQSQTQRQDRQRPQQQERQQPQSHTRPQVRQQDRQTTQQQTRPQTRQQSQQRPQRQTQHQQSRHQIPPQNRQRFTAPHAPQRRTQRNAQPRYSRYPDGRIDRTPRYHNGVWYGRAAPNDRRFRLRQPYVHGRFYRVGPRYYHRIIRFNRARYWFWLSSGYYFQIAYWDWPYCADWCWSCGDQFMIYLDPDHPGWYLVLNVQTGVYVHAIFMGR